MAWGEIRLRPKPLNTFNTRLWLEQSREDCEYAFQEWQFNSANVLAKAVAFTQINLFLEIERKDKAIKEYEAELEKRKIQSKRRYDYPNLGSR